MAKKYNKGRKQKPNINRQKLEKYREEIAKELGINENLKSSESKSKEKNEGKDYFLE